MSETDSSIPELVDTHAHLTDERFSGDLDDVIRRAASAGVSRIVTLATTGKDTVTAVEIAHRFTGVYCGVGIHPNESADATAADWETVTQLSLDPDVVAIGETGLDRHWDRAPFSLQQEYFERHLHLARTRHLPIVIHARDCLRELLDQLKRHPSPLRGVLHSFTGTWEEACEGLELGLHLSFAGMLTFQNQSVDSLRDVAARVPLERLLVETDSPYLSPHPLRGRRNEPAHVVHTAARLASLRRMSIADLAGSTTSNACRLFGLDSRPRLGFAQPS